MDKGAVKTWGNSILRLLSQAGMQHQDAHAFLKISQLCLLVISQHTALA